MELAVGGEIHWLVLCSYEHSGALSPPSTNLGLRVRALAPTPHAIAGGSCSPAVGGWWGSQWRIMALRGALLELQDSEDDYEDEEESGGGQNQNYGDGDGDPCPNCGRKYRWVN